MEKFWKNSTFIIAKGSSLLLILWMCIHPVAVISQDSSFVKYKNVLYLEILGNGLLKSLNYERLFMLKNNLQATTRAGIGSYRGRDVDSSSIIVVPVELNFLLGRENKYLEIGFGFTQTFGPRTIENDGLIVASIDYDYNYILRVGYRHQKYDGRVFYRVAVTPLLYRDFTEDEKFTIAPWIGLSVGTSW